jgi:hypothetical protein
MALETVSREEDFTAAVYWYVLAGVLSLPETSHGPNAA